MKPTVISFKFMGFCAIFISLFIVSCGANVIVKPEVPFSESRNSIIVRGNILYEGNPTYLPVTVEQTKEAAVTIKYAYIVSYAGTGNVEILAAFLPTTILGVPTGGDDR